MSATADTHSTHSTHSEKSQHSHTHSHTSTQTGKEHNTSSSSGSDGKKGKEKEISIASEDGGRLTNAFGADEVEQRVTLDELYDWPIKLSIDLYADSQQKIAFLSGQDREYFPSKPGHSRFAVEYALNSKPGDTPNPSYYPVNDTLQKPISRKGYGIGGLSAPRFPTHNHFLAQHFEDHHNRGDGSGGSTEYDRIQKAKEEQIRWRKSKARVRKSTKEICRQKHWAFGSSLQDPRFVYSSSSETVGAGAYPIQKVNLCKRVSVPTSFGKGPVMPLKGVELICNYESFDKCEECLRILTTTDYYRSKRAMSIPKKYYEMYSRFSEEKWNHDIEILDSVQRVFRLLRNSRSFKTPTSSSSSFKVSQSHSSTASGGGKKGLESEGVKMSPPKPIAFCRECYCYVTKHGHEYWTNMVLLDNFIKVRHCVNVHEHNNFPTCIKKVDCGMARRLQKKEVLMNQYFPDGCGRSEGGGQVR